METATPAVQMEYEGGGASAMADAAGSASFDEMDVDGDHEEL